jgi:hypothetical protein
MSCRRRARLIHRRLFREHAPLASENRRRTSVVDPPFSGRTARLPWGEVYIFGPVQGALATDLSKVVNKPV